MVTGNDVDSGPPLSYLLVLDSSVRGTFGILRYGGRVTLMGPLDYEQRRHYVLTVRASDSQHETEANLTVLVEDVNDNAPLFGQALYQVGCCKGALPPPAPGRQDHPSGPGQVGAGPKDTAVAISCWAGSAFHTGPGQGLNACWPEQETAGCKERLA